MAGKNKTQSCCELCANYVYDEELDEYVCSVNLDEDDMASFISHAYRECPFFRYGDEYAVVRKQN